MYKFIKCHKCQKFYNNDSNNFIYIRENGIIKYFHKNCFAEYNNKFCNNNLIIYTIKTINNNEEKIILYERLATFNFYINKYKASIEKTDYKIEIISKFFHNCQEKFKNFSKIFDEKIMIDEIEIIKENLVEQFYEKKK